MAMDFAIYYSHNNGKQYYTESLIEGKHYDAKFCEYSADGYDCEESEKEFELKIQRSNQFKQEISIQRLMDIRIAIDKVPIQ
jgi:hypothetical protein